MKKIFLKIIPWVLIVLLLGLTIKFMKTNQDLKNENFRLSRSKQKIHLTDTVYISEPFKKESHYNEMVQPERIALYKPNASSEFNYRDSGDSRLYPSQSLYYHKDSSATTLGTGDSLVQFIINPNNLKLSYFNRDSQIFLTREFDLDLREYSYNWNDNMLTKNKNKLTNKIKPFISGSIRPKNRLLDFNMGLYFETKSINYKLSLNSFYYPKFQNKIGYDIEFTMVHYFK